LGLLHYQEGMIKKSVDALKKHFTIAKEDSDETKN
jgi:hypothetical protein